MIGTKARIGGTKRAKNTASVPQRLKNASLCAITPGYLDIGQALEDFALRAMAGPERRAVAEQGAGDRRRQHAPQLQFAAGHQRAQGKDDGRARHQRPHDRDRLQQGREE